MFRLFSVLLIVLILLGQNESQEKAKILKTLHTIFQAFVDKDNATLEATHSSDWTGFKAGSDHIVNYGIKGYMKSIAFNNPMIDFKIDESEIKLYNDIAVVYYVATYRNLLTKFKQILTTHVRSVDIYKKINGEWIQAGSNLNVIPTQNALRMQDSEKYFMIEFKDADK